MVFVLPTPGLPLLAVKIIVAFGMGLVLALSITIPMIFFTGACCALAGEPIITNEMIKNKRRMCFMAYKGSSIPFILLNNVTAYESVMPATYSHTRRMRKY